MDQEQLDDARWETISPICFANSANFANCGYDNADDNSSYCGDEEDEDDSVDPSQKLPCHADGSQIRKAGQRMMMENDKAPRHTKKGRVSGSSVSQSKEKRSNSLFSPRGSKYELFAAYVHLEENRCRKFGLPSPEECFRMIISQTRDASLGTDETTMALKVLYFTIASSESLAALGDIAQTHRRRSLSGNQLSASCDLSRADRLRVIDRLDEDIAYYSLLKRCHVHRLFVDSTRSSRKTVDGFVNDTVESISSRQRPKIGNPSHNDDAFASMSIMVEVYPEIRQDSFEYRRKYRYITDLRKLGQRLHLLVEKFGYGILGLLLSPSDMSAVEPSLGLSDTLLVKIS